MSRLKYVSLQANLGLGQGLLVYPILLSFIPLSGRTEMFMTGILINQSINSNKYSNDLNPPYLSISGKKDISFDNILDKHRVI